MRIYYHYNDTINNDFIEDFKECKHRYPDESWETIVRFMFGDNLIMNEVEYHQMIYQMAQFKRNGVPTQFIATFEGEIQLDTVLNCVFVSYYLKDEHYLTAMKKAILEQLNRKDCTLSDKTAEEVFNALVEKIKGN